MGRGQWLIPRPTSRIAIAQVVLSTADWAITGAVLYAFLPAHSGLTLWFVLGSYLIAQTLAVTSHVPAGAGVFEVVVVALLVRGAPGVRVAGLAAALVMFRVTYYLVPLCVAMLMAVVSERSGHPPVSSPLSARRLTNSLEAGPVQRAR